jgi:hypothetical protein
MSEFFMIEACIHHIISVATTYTHYSVFYFILCAHDGLPERHRSLERTVERIIGEEEYKNRRFMELEENEYPIFHRGRWIMGQSTLVGMPNAIDVVDRHYFFHNLYHAFRSWHRGIDFLDKRPEIVFGGQERGTHTNFIHRRDITISQREYFFSNAVSKKHVASGRGWIDRSDQIYYRYILDIDGNASTWDATAWKLNSGSVIFKVESGWRQWFYNEYKPHVHYIPIRDDFSDLDEKFEWCEAHPDECQKMITNCQGFFQKIYRFSNVVKYTLSVLEKICAT